MSILIAIIIFSAIILFHELGHFLLAKKNGIEVIEFSLGMGPRILSTVKGGTRYSWKLLPIGGSCAMRGEDDEEDAPGTFNGASVWGRISVVAAGPIFNFILAFVFSVIMVGLIGYTPATVATVEEGSPAAEAGLQAGDQITEFDGYHIDMYEDLNIYTNVMGIPEDSINMTVKRDGQTQEISYKPQVTNRYLLGFNYSSEEKLEVASIISGMPMEDSGIQVGDIITAVDGYPINTVLDYNDYLKENPLSGDTAVTITYEHNGQSNTTTVTPATYQDVSVGFQMNTARQKGTIIDTVYHGFLTVKYWIRTTILSLKELVTGHFGLKDLSGPVGVVNMIGETYEQSRAEGALWVLVNILNMSILLSANLGVMNLLPLPALDGGRLVFLIIEAIIRRPVNRKVEGMVHFVGLMLLMLLMVVVMYNDVLRII